MIMDCREISIIVGVTADFIFHCGKIGRLNNLKRIDDFENRLGQPIIKYEVTKEWLNSFKKDVNTILWDFQKKSLDSVLNKLKIKRRCKEDFYTFGEFVQWNNKIANEYLLQLKGLL